VIVRYVDVVYWSRIGPRSGRPGFESIRDRAPFFFTGKTGRPMSHLAFFPRAGWVGVFLRHMPNGRVGVVLDFF